jgi:hypothetical protein
MDAELRYERDFDMNVNSVSVNNQFDKYVLSTGASTSSTEHENTHLQEIVDEYIQDIVMLGNNEPKNEYERTLELLKELEKKMYADFLAKDRTYVPKHPQPGEILQGKALLPGKMPHIDDFMPPGLNNQPTGMYDPVAAITRHNALISSLNDWSRAMFEYYGITGGGISRQFQEWLKSDDYKQKMEAVRERDDFINAMPQGELIRFEDMDPKLLMSFGFFQQADSD